MRDFYSLRVQKDLATNETKFEEIPDEVERSFRNMNFGRDVIEEFETELIDLTLNNVTAYELCHEDHCCSFTLETETQISNSTFQYRFVAFNGHRTYSGWGNKKVVICAIIVCNADSLDSCGRMPDYELQRVTFKTIEITTSFNRFGVLMMPNSLDMTMNPLPVDDFSYSEFVVSEELRTSTMNLMQPHSDLQTFALYGHDYETDDEFDFDGSGWDDASGDEIESAEDSMNFENTLEDK